MSEGSSTGGTTITEENDPDVDRPAAELRAELDLLAEENRRLREEYVRARRSRYRRTAAGLAAIGVVAVLGGILFPAARTVLFALGATGLFGALLTYYLTPERFLAASVGEAVYDAVAATGEGLVSELGLREHRRYVPLDRPDRPAVLFVPQHTDHDVPDADDLAATFVVTEDDRARGVAVRPTGASLFRAFERALAGPLAEDPARLADQLADGLRGDLELAEHVRPGDVDDDSVAVAIEGSSLGDVDRFDHPVASFLGVGFAVGLGRVVDVEVHDADRADVLVRCSWDEAE